MQWAARGAIGSALSRTEFLSLKRKALSIVSCSVQLLSASTRSRHLSPYQKKKTKQCMASARMKGGGVGLPMHVHNKVPRGNM